MTEHLIRIQKTEKVTHDVIRFRVDKPDGYSFVPGQATDVSVTIPEFRDKKRPFSFTCLNSDPYLEFTIKIYTERKGVTNELSNLNPGDKIIISEPFGTISYKGKGTFIAGGAGITPFIAIFRDLQKKHTLKGNRLLFANKTRADIIMETEFSRMLGNNFINILSDEKAGNYTYGYISEEFLKANIHDLSGNFYVCGPPRMTDMVLKQLANLGIEKDATTIEL